MEMAEVKCPSCDSLHVVKKGFGVVKPGIKKQRWHCRDCGKTFYGGEVAV